MRVPRFRVRKGRASASRPEVDDLFGFGDSEKFFSDFSGMTDRHAVILVTANIEQLLLHAILAHMTIKDADTIERLTGRDGALSSLYARTHLAYAMGLFHKTIRDDLDRIRRIRNHFAHSSSASAGLTDADPARELSKLKFLNELDEEMRKNVTDPPKYSAGMPIERLRFLCTALCIGIFVSRRTHRHLEQKLEKLNAKLTAAEKKTSR